MENKPPYTVALIGGGAIAHVIARELITHHTRVHLAGVLVHDPAKARECKLAGNVPLASSLPELLSYNPVLIAECAGHSGLAEYGAAVLANGIDLVVASVGALADPELERSLRVAAESGGSHLHIPSGAVGGLDALASAKLGGLARVHYIGRKPVDAWRGTRAEAAVDLDAVTQATVIFEGSAREAALQFPQNANVAAAIALSGVGFDATRVQLIADPQARGNEHLIEAEGAFGRLTFSVVGTPMAGNPKTSNLAAYSLLRALISPVETIQI
ncbi:MAG TPA: aspartate dehydrogenase [Burkholderiales bacterium]|nr:aspartate dehydrogenase [Burkholderiales bacterium]